MYNFLTEKFVFILNFSAKCKTENKNENTFHESYKKDKLVIYLNTLKYIFIFLKRNVKHFPDSQFKRKYILRFNYDLNNYEHVFKISSENVISYLGSC